MESGRCVGENSCAIEECLRRSREPDRLHAMHCSIRNCHIHQVVDAGNREALGADMHGRHVRIARGQSRARTHRTRLSRALSRAGSCRGGRAALLAPLSRLAATRDLLSVRGPRLSSTYSNREVRKWCLRPGASADSILFVEAVWPRARRIPGPPAEAGAKRRDSGHPRIPRRGLSWSRPGLDRRSVVRDA